MKQLGVFLMLVSLMGWIVDRLSGVISTICCRYFCGETYTKALDGMIVDRSCGFNATMYLAMGMVLVFILGSMLIRFSKETISEEERV